MKNTILFLFAATIVSASLNAQITLGPAGGAQVTRYYTAPKVKGNKIAVDMRLGVLANVPVSTKWSLQPGILFTTNSNHFVDPKNPTMHSRFRINSIEVPLAVTRTLKFKNGGFFFTGLGAYAAININGTADIALTDYIGNYVGNMQYDITVGKPSVPSIRRVEKGIGLYAGCELKSGFSIRAHCQNGIGNVYNQKYYAVLRHRNYGLTLAYLFPLKKAKKEPPSE